jgi:HK97 family phage prohead protease
MTLQLYWPITKIDSDERLVYGYASTEATDSQGEIVRKEALEAALPAYMRFANIREMHRPSAVGVAKEATLDDTGLWLKAKIVDDEAWRKVKEGVYKGFSIGGAVTGRDGGNPQIVTGVELTEISLVDRPANPDAVFALWKSDADAGALKTARARLAQKWVASDGSAFARADDAARHEAHLAKATFAPAAAPTSGITAYDLEGAKGAGGAFADPGFQADGRKRYPLDSEPHIRAAWRFILQEANRAPYTKEQLDHIEARITAAWKAKIDPGGPSAASDGDAAKLAKSLAEGGDLAPIQSLHDHAVSLGAVCHGGEASAKSAGAAMAKLIARSDALEERLGAALPLLREVKELVEKIAAQPAVVPPARLVAIDKGTDVARELERIAEQPPALTALELIKRAVREPLPFGARLEK